MLPLPLQFGEALVHRFSQVLYRCFEEVGSTKAALYLLIPEAGGFQLVTHFGWPRTLPPPEALLPEDPLVVWASRERRSFAVNQASQIPELARFAQGESPRFLITPFYDRGEWVGLLIQKDRTKGLPFELPGDEGPTQSICQEIVEALRDFWAGRAVSPSLTHVPEASPRMDVPVPPSAAMMPANAPMADPVEEFLEGFQATPGQSTAFAPIPSDQAHLNQPPDPRVLSQPVSVRQRAGMFMPEQRTFFWEAATLLCNLLPLAAVALWMDEATEVRPILTYSRQPLSPELKQQVLAHVTYHVPQDAGAGSPHPHPGGVPGEGTAGGNLSDLPARDAHG